MLSFINNVFGQQDVGFKKADRVLKKLVRKKKVPGIAITITKNGETQFSKGYGYADLDRELLVNPATTIFRVGSVSKPISATGLAKMVAKNQLKLSDSIYDCVSYFPKKEYGFTIRQLGGHLAGIRSYKDNEFMNNKPLTIKEGVSLFENDTLLFQPGKGYSYTSYSWNLLSLVMQEVAQKPFEDIINDEVLVPLGLKNTFPDKQQELVGKAICYLKKRKRKFIEATPVHNFFKLAGGGYLSTSEDIAKLGNAYLTDEFLSDEVKDKFTTSQKIKEELTYYGVGWQASYDHKNRPYFGHIGNGLGGYGIFYVYPKENIVVSILMNCSNPYQDERFYKIIDAVFDELAEGNN
ncbi:MAG: beta-lactamase family protein [Flavobacteriaceae bacterium]|nr:beta-lactamase family protein [Flavobacteriaceae bacterium]